MSSSRQDLIEKLRALQPKMNTEDQRKRITDVDAQKLNEVIGAIENGIKNGVVTREISDASMYLLENCDKQLEEIKKQENQNAITKIEAQRKRQLVYDTLNNITQMNTETDAQIVRGNLKKIEREELERLTNKAYAEEQAAKKKGNKGEGITWAKIKTGLFYLGVVLGLIILIALIANPIGLMAVFGAIASFIALAAITMVAHYVITLAAIGIGITGGYLLKKTLPKIVNAFKEWWSKSSIKNKELDKMVVENIKHLETARDEKFFDEYHQAREAALKPDLEELEKAVSNQKTAEAAYQQAERDVRTTETTIAALEKEQAQYKETHREETASVTDLKKQLTDLNTELSAAQRYQTSIERYYGNQQSVVSNNTDYIKTSKRCTALESQIKTVESKIENKTGKIEQADKKLKEIKPQLAQATSSLKEAKTKRDVAKQTAKNATQKVETSEGMMQDTQKKIPTLTSLSKTTGKHSSSDDDSETTTPRSP